MTRTACQTVQTRNRITRAARPFEKVPCVLYPDKAANGKPVKNAAACLSCTPTLIKKVYHRGTLFNSSQLFYNSFFKKRGQSMLSPFFYLFSRPSIRKSVVVPSTLAARDMNFTDGVRSIARICVTVALGIRTRRASSAVVILCSRISRRTRSVSPYTRYIRPSPTSSACPCGLRLYNSRSL